MPRYYKLLLHTLSCLWPFWLNNSFNRNEDRQEFFWIKNNRIVLNSTNANTSICSLNLWCLPLSRVLFKKYFTMNQSNSSINRNFLASTRMWWNYNFLSFLDSIVLRNTSQAFISLALLWRAKHGLLVVIDLFI